MGEYIDNKTKTSQDKVSNDKLKTSFAKIIVEGTSERPFYEILYFDPSNNDFYIGFGSYCLEYVIKWFNEEFEIDKSKVFDVAPVVRCKNCRMATKDIMIDGWYHCENNLMTHRPDCFCSYGVERKE